MSLSIGAFRQTNLETLDPTVTSAGAGPAGAASRKATADAQPDRIDRAERGSPFLTADLSAAGRSNNIAAMSLAQKVQTTASAGFARAAQDTGSAVGTFLKDPKNDALMLGGTAAILGAQAVPGLDVGVDVTLGIVGAAMYASAGPDHRANITQALGKLKDYAGEVGGARSQADLDKASGDFAAFLKIGGNEAIEAFSVVAGAGAAGTKLAGLAAKVKEMGGLDGVMAAGSKGLGNLEVAITSTYRDVRHGIDAAGTWLDDASATLGPRFAVPEGLAPQRARGLDATSHMLESRAQSVGSSARRDVAAHEAAGGHTILEHVGKSSRWLRARLDDDPSLAAASTFTSEESANRAQGAFLKNNRDELQQWLKDPSQGPTYTKIFDTGQTVGRVMTRDSPEAISTSKARFVITRDDSAHGWHFVTSFPVR